jgi:hypothetical protein
MDFTIMKHKRMHIKNRLITSKAPAKSIETIISLTQYVTDLLRFLTQMENIKTIIIIH